MLLAPSRKSPRVAVVGAERNCSRQGFCRHHHRGWRHRGSQRERRRARREKTRKERERELTLPFVVAAELAVEGRHRRCPGRGGQSHCRGSSPELLRGFCCSYSSSAAMPDRQKIALTSLDVATGVVAIPFLVFFAVSCYALKIFLVAVLLCVFEVFAALLP
ncbi:uncharacterized protein DS421_3g90780 [Arachis hypogaea]|nr:uncharacterized protein DS421_3g90780 [Arachis hypogaea]